MRLMRVGARGDERPVVPEVDDRAYDITPLEIDCLGRQRQTFTEP
jgi:hypothetical protein